MKGYSQFLFIIVSLGIASQACAIRSWESLQAQYADKTSGPDYQVTGKNNQFVTYLDGIAKGCGVSDEGALHRNYKDLKGYRLTDMRTHQTGIITGIHRYGTMDVVTSEGKTIRYQYVKFNVR